MSYFDPLSSQNKPILNYFKDKTLLIADSKEISRNSIRKIMTTLGFIGSNIKVSDTAEKAIVILNDAKPHYVVANLELGKHTGLDLLESHLQIRPNRMEAGFFIISENNSLSSATIILNFPLEGYIPIPFTVKGFQESVLRTIKSKIKPSPYKTLIEEGISCVYKEDFKNAKKIMQKAQEVEENAIMALYYEGLSAFFEDDLEEAQEKLKKALKLNPKLYLAYRDLYRIYENLGKNKDAYEMAIKMAELYPVNYENFPHLTRLCIKTGHYSDILKFYSIVRKAGIDSMRVKIYISAGLIIYGKVLIKKEEKAAGIDAIKKAGLLCPNKFEILKNVIKTCLEQEDVSSAEQVLDYAKKNDVNDLIYEILNFKILVKKDGPDKILIKGKKLVMSELKDLEIYLDLIEALKEKGGNSKDLEFVITEAKKDYPLNKEEIDKAAA